MTDELRKLATFAYECGLVGSVGNVWHSVTIRDGLTRGRELADELVAANVELDRLREQVELMARTLQRSAHDDRDALIAASLQQGVDAFSVCTCNAEDETKCSACGQCSRCHGLCDCEIHPGTRCADCEADEDHCTCEDGFNPTSTGGDE